MLCSLQLQGLLTISQSSFFLISYTACAESHAQGLLRKPTTFSGALTPLTLYLDVAAESGEFGILPGITVPAASERIGTASNSLPFRCNYPCRSPEAGCGTRGTFGQTRRALIRRRERRHLAQKIALFGAEKIALFGAENE